MTTYTPQTPPDPSTDRCNSRSPFLVWLSVLAVALLILFALDYLLGLVIWLPLYCGLFGFLVAGLIAGGTAFRLARKLRPISRGRIWATGILLTLFNAPTALFFEYHHVASGVGELAGFSKLRVRAAKEGSPRADIVERIELAFRDKLTSDFPPGGFLGYARWCVQSGEMPLQVDDASDIVSVSHRGWRWVIRSVIALVLTFVGLCFSFDGLRSAVPVRNILAPGEEYEDIDD